MCVGGSRLCLLRHKSTTVVLCLYAMGSIMFLKDALFYFVVLGHEPPNRNSVIEYCVLILNIVFTTVTLPKYTFDHKQALINFIIATLTFGSIRIFNFESKY